MTITRISEIVRGYLGWCPHNSVAPVRKKLLWSDTSTSALQIENDVQVRKDLIVDYGSTGLSIPLFTIIFAGTIAGLFAIMTYDLFENWSSFGLLIMSIFILGAAVRMVYQDIKKAIIEFTPDAITVRLPLFRPVLIPKDAITTLEVQKNIHYSHRWLFRGAMVLFFLGIVPSILFSGHTQYVSRMISRVSFTVFVVYYLAVIVFFALVFYHGYIRSRYSHVLAICTNRNKIIGLYVDDPEEMSDKLSKWHQGVV
jgi:hypothetical protein